MAKPKLVAISIRPSANGGHHVRHEYQSKPAYQRGAVMGGLTGMPATEEHTFGPDDHQNLMQHIAQALAIKQLAKGRQNGEQPKMASARSRGAPSEDQDEEA